MKRPISCGIMWASECHLCRVIPYAGAVLRGSRRTRPELEVCTPLSPQWNFAECKWTPGMKIWWLYVGLMLKIASLNIKPTFFQVTPVSIASPKVEVLEPACPCGTWVYIAVRLIFVSNFYTPFTLLGFTSMRSRRPAKSSASNRGAGNVERRLGRSSWHSWPPPLDILP